MTDDVRQGAGREPMTWLNGKMVPRREAEQILKAQKAEAAAGTTPPGRPVPVSVPADDPDETDPPGDAEAQVRVQASTAPGPGGPHPDVDVPAAPVTPPRIRSSVPPTPIGIEDIALDIASDRGVWYVGVYRKGEKVADDASRSNPLITKGTAKRIAGLVKKEFPHLDQRVVQDAITRFFEAVRGADEALTSDAVCRVISEIARVERETSDPPTYVVYLANGERMVFSTVDLTGGQPVVLNSRWLAAKGDLLDATGRDFKEISEYIVAEAVPVDPPGPTSPWERTLSKLITRIAPVEMEPDRRGLGRYGICLEPDGVMLVRSDIIQDVMVECNQNPNDGGFARYLKREGILIVHSKRYRIPGTKIPVRAWGLTPDIKDDLAEGQEGSLSEDPGGDR